MYDYDVMLETDFVTIKLGSWKFAFRLNRKEEEDHRKKSLQAENNHLSYEGANDDYWYMPWIFG